MPFSFLYQPSLIAKRCASAALAVGTLMVSGCGTINPNFFTIVNRDTADYTISGSMTRGFASRPRLAYILSEGDSPDQGSMRTRGEGAGITPQLIYTPTALLDVRSDGRFDLKVTSSRRYVLVRLYGWDDVNSNGVRDINETLGTEYTLKKEDLRGWTYTAADWNQFNFSFTR
jgi:hypothetical protein